MLIDDLDELNPLIPTDKWYCFCLDNVLYHGKILTIVWDKTSKNIIQERINGFC